MAGIFGLLLSGAAQAVKDTYFNLVSLLLPGNGTNGATNNSFLDSSSNAFTVTRNGNTTQGSFSPFSQTGWGNYFNGSSYLTAPNNTALDLSTGDFTIECWFYPTSFSSTSALIFRYNGNFATGNDFQYGISVNTSGAVTVRPYQGTTDFSINAGTAVLNSWNHIALVRTGNTFWGFLNGNRSASSQTITGALNNSTWATTVGATLSGTLGNSYANGYISNVRITKGGALYTTSTYTVPVTPLTTTVSAGTVSLLTCQSNRFFDIGTANSGTGFPITVNGSPSVVAFSPFAPTAAYTTSVVGGSGYFDGNGDSLNTASNTAFNLGTGDFTWEFWTYLSGTEPDGSMLFQPRTPAGIDSVLFGYKSGSNYSIYATTNGSSWNLFSNVTIIAVSAVVNRWAHWAFVRNGSVYSVYVDGELKTSATSASSISQLTNVFTFMAGIPGYMGSFRFVKGQALATGAFTPPASPVTTSSVGWTGANVPTQSITGSVNLLLNFTNGAIFDATAKNDLETVGNAQISTTQSKWGGSSIYLDGTGDYLAGATKSSVYFNLTGDFTIETWAYFTTVATGFAGIVSWADSSGFNGWELINNAGTVYFRFLTGSTGVGQVTAGSAISANQWYYISVIRSGSTITLYINGSSVGSTTYSGSQTSESSFLKVGADRVGTSLMTGYLQDMRISKYVRPTTVPTAPFPVQ